jgi:hypothetical protein
MHAAPAPGYGGAMPARHPSSSELLSRDDWREAVFARDGHCVICSAPAEDAHHIIERKLWDDGGYYLSNGVALCDQGGQGCHLKAERTEISCEELREAAGLTETLLPPQLTPDERWDKWGNVIDKAGRLHPGVLFQEEQVQKVLAEAGKLEDVVKYVKHARTVHLPWSPGATADDIELGDLKGFAGHEVVVTEKADGENTSVYRDHVHARSIDSKYHPSRERVKKLQAEVGWEIPEGWRVVGENMQAKHAIYYDALPSYFLVFAVFNERNECLSWDETLEWAELLGLATVPVLYRGPWDEEAVKACWTGESRLGGKQEGYVVRVADRIPYRDWQRQVAKYVRQGHVLEGSEHWAHEEMTPNKLAE